MGTRNVSGARNQEKIMSKLIHTAQLLDRFSTPDGLVIRAQNDRGLCFDVRVPEEHREEAGALWGRGTVRYEYRGGKAFFSPRESYDE